MKKDQGKTLLVLAGSESARELGRAVEALGIVVETEPVGKEASKSPEIHQRIGAVLMDRERAVGLLAAETLLRTSLAAMRSFLDYTRKLEDVPIERLYALISDEARSIFGAAAAAVASYDEEGASLVAEEISWSDAHETAIRKLISRGFKGMAAPVDDGTRRRMLELKVGAAKDLSEFSFGLIPKGVSDAVEKGLGIGWFRGLVLVSQGRLFGGIGIAGDKRSSPPAEALLSVFAEITANAVKRRQAEERVASLLKEKELLLKEVHHRVKNHFSTAISLLSLQAKVCSSAEAIGVLNDAQGRLQAMNTLYDRLYRSVDLRKMSLRAYLPDLVEEIAELFPNRRSARVSVDCEDIVLAAKPLSILGIIVNELVSNSMKYAFPEGRTGEIKVEARAAGERVIVRIADDGVGLPADLDPEHSTGFGLGLVRILAEQLGGTLKIWRASGAVFVIDFDRRTEG